MELYETPKADVFFLDVKDIITDSIELPGEITPPSEITPPGKNETPDW